MATGLRGIVHGRTIELLDETGLPDGSEVTVDVIPAPVSTSPTGPEVVDALRRAAGTWSDDPEGLDRYLDWNREHRKATRPALE